MLPRSGLLWASSWRTLGVSFVLIVTEPLCSTQARPTLGSPVLKLPRHRESSPGAWSRADPTPPPLHPSHLEPSLQRGALTAEPGPGQATEASVPCTVKHLNKKGMWEVGSPCPVQNCISPVPFPSGIHGCQFLGIKMDLFQWFPSH